MWEDQDNKRGNAADGMSPTCAMTVRMLDIARDGIVLVSAQCRIAHLNDAARQALGQADTPLRAEGAELRVSQSDDRAALEKALHLATRKGLQSMIALGAGARFMVIVSPLAAPGQANTHAVVSLPRTCLCDELSVQFYARAKGLTPAETEVLTLLCEGVCPAQVASRRGTEVSCVRTQIGAIRAKAGEKDIRGVILQIARLPAAVHAPAADPLQRVA